TSERIHHRVTSDGKGGWRVSELRRQAWVEEPAPVVVPDSVPERPLKYLGTVRLGGRDADRAAIRGVHQFDLDDQGRFGFARGEGRCDVTLAIGSLEGGDPRELPLGRLGQEGCGELLVAWAGGSTWLVSAKFATAERGGVGWWVDAASGAARPLKLPAGVAVQAISGRPGGGAVVLGELDSYTTLLLWLDAEGGEQGRFSEGAHSSASQLLSPEDVTVAASGETLVSDNIQHRVTVFDAKGALQRTIDLKRAWGREPSYPSGISRDADGGFVCEDFGAPIPFVRMRADGTMKGSLRPRYADGRPTGRLFRVRASADGRLWGSDGEALLRLGEDGVVEKALGQAAHPDDLGEIAATAVDASDRIYAADRRTGAVHVFGTDGKPHHVCRPEPDDVAEALQSPSLTVAADGRVYLRVGDMLEGGFLEFSPEGQRLALHESEDQAWLSNAASGGLWAIGYQDIALADEKGRKARTVGRRADGKWLGWISTAMAAPDGSLAVAAGSVAIEAKGWTLNLYDGEGSPIRTLVQREEAAQENFAYDGHHLALWQAGEVRILDLTGKALLRFKPTPDGRTASDWSLLFAARGRELWMVDRTARTIHRYEMP
ncbi:MAG TPA: hypothetical protein VF153_00075, partial [Candidatus Limnocylindria bacterium]